MNQGLRLAELRGSTPQRTIAERIGVKPQAVSNWERGINAVDPDHLAALDAALGAGGEVMSLYAPGSTGITLEDIAAGLNRLRDGQVELLAEMRNAAAQSTEAVAEAVMALARQMAQDQPRNGGGAGQQR